MNKLPKCYKSFKERKARLAYMRKWHAENRERQNRLNSEYQKKHPEKHREASRRYVAKHRKSRTRKTLSKTATWLGRRAELDALRILLRAVDLNKEIMNNKGHDLLWRGKKIDVKSSNGFLHKGRYLQWAFGGKATSVIPCDLYLCLAYQENELHRAFLIPSNLYHKKGITICPGTVKWLKFEVKLEP